jgi:vacuolar-type H+-ATPase subunit F/Vma7
MPRGDNRGDEGMRPPVQAAEPELVQVMASLPKPAPAGSTNVKIDVESDMLEPLATPVGYPTTDEVVESIIDIQTILTNFNDITFDVESNYLLKVIKPGLTPLNKDMYITGIYIVSEGLHTEDEKTNNFVNTLKSGHEYDIIIQNKQYLKNLLFKDDDEKIHTVKFNSDCLALKVDGNVRRGKVITEKKQGIRLKLEEKVEGFVLVGYNNKYFNNKENTINAFRALLKHLMSRRIKSIKIVQSVSPVKDALVVAATAVPVDDTSGGKFRRRYRKRTHHKKSKKSKKHHKMSKKQNKRSKTYRKRKNKKTHRKY